jgi:hypothetical protein
VLHKHLINGRPFSKYVLAHFFSFFNAKEVAGLPPSNALSLELPQTWRDVDTDRFPRSHVSWDVCNISGYLNISICLLSTYLLCLYIFIDS